jgi:hypothetical protein
MYMDHISKLQSMWAPLRSSNNALLSETYTRADRAEGEGGFS